MNNSIFGKPRENVTKHQKLKLLSNEKRKHVVEFELNHHSGKWFSGKLLVIGMKSKFI